MRVNFLAERDYAHGYQKALSDVKNWFNNHSDTLKYHRMFSSTGVLTILSAMEKNSEIMQDCAEDTEFNFKVENKKLKVFVREEE